MLKRVIRNVHEGQKGITGLETAIILIAFVVVAAVFAYTVLSAGLFSAQKSSESVYQGLEEAQSTIELRGSVVAYATAGSGASTADSCDRSSGTSEMTSTTGSIVTRIQFTIANVLGGEPIDLTAEWSLTTSGTVDPPTDIVKASTDNHVVVISYDDMNKQMADCTWTRAFVGKNDGDNLLEQDEKATVTVWLVEYGTNSEFRLDATGATNGTFFSDADETNDRLVGTNHEFRLQVKPPQGAVLRVERRTPPRLNEVMDLH